MATSSQSVTLTPTALSGLVVGKGYAVQNTGNGISVYINQGNSVPSPNTNDAHIIDPGVVGIVKLLTGESAYVWTLIGATRVAISPSS